MSYGLLEWTVVHLNGLNSDSFLAIAFLDAKHVYNMWAGVVRTSGRRDKDVLYS